PTKITREDGSYVELKYDDSLRLEKETYYDANGVQEEEIAYSYDAEGNRQTVSSGEAQGSYDYENIHQLTQIDTSEGLETYYYDDGGRLETITREGETWQLRYNADDLIIEVKKGENIVVQYAYDSAGRRVEMMDGEGEKDYLVAPLMGGGLESPHLVMDGVNDPLAAYVYAGNMPLMRLDEQGNPTYYLEDGMGSIVSLANNSGVEVAEFEYDSFGNLRGDSFIANELGGDFRFQGQWLESNTDFYHFRARYYDPETGRFVSRDPIDIIETEPESSNPYQFVYNNPHIYSDPTGMFTIQEQAVTRQIQGILRKMGTKVRKQALENAIDKAKDVVSKNIESIFNKIIPADVQDLVNIASLNNPKDELFLGNMLEDIILDTALKPVLGKLGDFVWRETFLEIDSGKPLSTGYRLSTGSPSDNKDPGLKGGSPPNADFLISATVPDNIRRGVGAFNKAWMIGDVKLSAKKPVEQILDKRPKAKKDQWLAMRNFSQHYQYIPAVTYVSLFTYDQTQIQKAKDEALKPKNGSPGVLLNIISLLNIPRPEK
ncbi:MULTISPECIES: RHS repeat-associated core domain-containing protein, partial [Spirulina sp. CCY15215]|uniref:RHS repeat domain-containing protein n=1 Tax=Spirulina sp. CCY15215 TaxID=2767591 RepID=UPI001950EFDD